MEPFENIREYTKIVCDQIRWKRVHPVISDEIINHIIDQRDAYIAEGVDEITATRNAITQMGDPVVIGTQLDRTHKPKPQWSMILLAVAMLFIGHFIRTFIHNGFIPRELVFTFVGLGFMAIAYFLDFTLIGRYPKTFYFSMLVLSIIALIISPTINGSAYYGRFIPLLFPLGFSAILYLMRNKGYPGIIICGISFLLPACIALLVPTISGALLFAASGLMILSIAIAKNWFSVIKLYAYLLIFIPTIVTSMLAGILVWRRLQLALNPSIDQKGGGWLGTVIRALLDNSKLLGHGDMPTEYASWIFPLPGIDSDFILTYIIFKFGWIAFFIIMGVMLFFIIKGFRLCFMQKSYMGLFISVSVMLTFTSQVIGYVIANLGFIFAGPISLPLISYGKIATIINLFLIGIMLSVFRTGDIIKDKSVGIIEENNFITWSDGKLIISLGKK